ncbi:callose synthase 5-like isoform X1 [Euphorbia lathyris]|uniref:callose synthase 5-like isoform X1 n=1 Tax=Euphorbia lathyris TaxID=212925 RepID=UPI0033144EF5
MVEYVKGLIDDRKNGNNRKLLDMVKEMERMMRKGKLEFEDARKKVRVPEEGKMEDNASNLAAWVKKTDAREIESFYQQYYEQYVRSHDQGDKADRAQLGKTYQTVGVLYAVSKTEKVEEVAPKIIAAARDVQEMNEIYAPYNILPLYSIGASQTIMQLEEAKAAVAALWNTRGLKWPIEFERHRQQAGDLDLFD